MNKLFNTDYYIQQFSYINCLKKFKIINYNAGLSPCPKFIGLDDSRKIFIKIVGDKESIILSEITKLKSPYILESIFPELLSENIFVANFISEDSQSKLNKEFLDEYFRMQQHFNNHNRINKLFGKDKSIYKNYNYIPFKESVANDINVALRIFHLLKRNVKDELLNYEFIFNNISLKKENIVNSFCSMPLRWLHNDFKINNLIGQKPYLIDWGMSYGMGAFLYDIAPFISKNLVDHFFDIISDQYNKNTEEIYRWLLSASSIRFIHELVWQYMHYFRTPNKIISNINTIEEQYSFVSQLKSVIEIF